MFSVSKFSLFYQEDDILLHVSRVPYHHLVFFIMHDL